MTSIAPESDPFLPILQGLLQDRRNQEEFFRLAYQHLMPASRRFPQIMDKDREDFVMEIIEKALLKLNQYSPKKGTFRAWLFIMARNLAYDRGRRQQHHQDVLHGALSEDVLEYETPPVAEEEVAESCQRPLQSQVNAALRRLPPKDQQLLTLVYSGMNASKAAEELNDTPQNIRQRHHRLLKKLTAELNSNPSQ